MAKSFSLQLKGKLDIPHGTGAKVIQGRMSMSPASEAVHVDDVELQTIQALFIQPQPFGTFIGVSVSTPGTYGNYASLVAYAISAVGTPAAIAGSHTLTFLAVGE